MGLDMYLTKANLHGHTPQEMECVEDYENWKAFNKRKKEDGEKPVSFKDYSGSKLPFAKVRELVKELGSEVHEAGNEYFHYKSAFTEVGYWRKANAIHNWFVENVQNGNDDCGVYSVSKEQLEDLLGICDRVIEVCKSHLVNGKVSNGSRYVNGKWEDILEDGVVLDEIGQTFCDSVLPTASGFFFGSTDYDEYYVNDIKETASIIQSVLDSTDFERETVCYHSSW